MDDHQDGIVSIAKIYRYFEEHDPDCLLSADEKLAMLFKADKNKDGYIELQEFLDMVSYSLIVWDKSTHLET